MKIKLIFLKIFIWNIVMAQEVINPAYGNVGRIYNVPSYNNLNVETKGSRFFNNENYVHGELKTAEDNIRTQDLTYRYDQIVRTLQVKYPDGREILVDPRDIVSFRLFIENKTFLFERTPLPDKSYEFLQVIYSSPTLRLLRDARKKKTRINTIDPYTSAPTGKYDQIENDYRYYLVFDNMNLLRPIEITKKSFANTIPHKAAKINQLFSMKEYRHDLSISKLSEMMRLLDDELKNKM